MNLEVQGREKIKKPLSKEQKEAKEKELQKIEIKEARKLCASYHKELDSKGYFNDKSINISRKLLPEFLGLNVKKLPKSVRLVVRHRIAYLKVMAELSKSNTVKAFMKKFSPRVMSGMGILSKNSKELEEHAKKSPEFRNLKESDFKLAIKAMKEGRKMLKPIINSSGNFASRAKKHLMPSGPGIKDSRVDDFLSSRNLDSGLKLLISNLSALQRKRKVLLA